MNKPVKLLAGVSVLAFASMGLYYAWLTPVKPAKIEASSRKPTDSSTKTTVGVTVNNPADETRRIPAPSQLDPAPTSGSSVAVAPSTPAGFKPVEQPMAPLPERLPGFEPVNAPPAVGVAAVPAAVPNAVPPAPATVPTPAPVPAAVATTQPKSVAGTPVSTPAPVVGAPAPAQRPASQVSVAPAPSQSPAPAPAPKAAPKVDTYTVKSGDTIVGIWSQLTGSERGWEKLLAANPGLEPERLKIGQVIKVPDASASAPARTPAAAATTTVATSEHGTVNGSYTVTSGDTLSRISEKVYGSSKLWKQIYDANKETIGEDPTRLKVGQVLHIPAKGGAAKGAGEKHAAGSSTSKPAASAPPAPSPAPASRPAMPPGTIGAPAVNPAGTPAPR